MPEIHAQSADGTVHIFPDGTPDAVIDKVMKEYTIPGLPPEGLPGIPKPQVNMQPSNLGTIATGPPLMSMQPGLPSAAQVPENAQAMSIGAAVGAPVGGLIAGGTAALPAIARSVAGGLVGGGTGEYLGNKIGPTTGHILGTLGGLAGGYAGARGIKVPTDLEGLTNMFKGEPTAPEYTPPAHEEIPSGSQEYPLSEKVKAGTAMKIPNRLTKAQFEALRPQEPAKLSDLATQVPSQGGSKLYGPESPAPPINKTYVSYPGDMLVELAKKGDLNAVRELIRNPRGINITDIPGVRYLIEQGRTGRVYGGPTE